MTFLDCPRLSLSLQFRIEKIKTAMIVRQPFGYIVILIYLSAALNWVQRKESRNRDLNGIVKTDQCNPAVKILTGTQMHLCVNK
jgi:hypothetical protein